MIDEKLPGSQIISPNLIRDVEAALREGRGSVAIALTHELHVADIADLTEALPPELRDVFVVALGQDLNRPACRRSSSSACEARGPPVQRHGHDLLYALR